MRLHWLIDNNNKYLEFVKSRPVVLCLSTFNKPIVNWMKQQIKWPMLSHELQSANRKCIIMWFTRIGKSTWYFPYLFAGVPGSEVTKKIHLITFFARPNKIGSNCVRAYRTHTNTQTNSIDDQRLYKTDRSGMQTINIYLIFNETSRSNWCIQYVHGIIKWYV